MQYKNKGSRVKKISILVLIVIGMSFFVYAQTQAELQAELDGLTQDLESAGYSWLVNYPGGVDSVFVENWNCSSTGYSTVKVLTSGVHNQLFNFGGMEAQAHNFATDGTYENISDVYWEFQWETNNIKLQVRSCDDASCSGEDFIGPDNTSSTYYDYVNNYTSNVEFGRERGNYNLLNVSDNRYFQYKAYLWKNVSIGQAFSPILYDVDIDIINSSSVEVETPISSSNSYALSQLNCTTHAEASRNINVTFNWYVDGGFFKSEIIETPVNQNVTASISEGITLPNEVWNCSVFAHHENGTSSNKSSNVIIGGYKYESINQVFYNFQGQTQNTLLQIRSCGDASCSGEDFIGYDNTSATWFNNSLNTSLIDINISNNRYFQYKVNLFNNRTIGQRFSPILYNVTINKTTAPNITEILTINESGVSGGDVEQGSNITFNVTINDSVGVDKVWVKIWQGAIGGAYYIWEFLTNVGGNVWSVTISTLNNWTVGDTNYTVYTNDTSGNEVNESNNFTILSSDTCSPTSPLSANYQFECTDYCNITSNIDFAEFNVTWNGTGEWNLFANISNFNRAFIYDGCKIYIDGGNKFI